jgi:hypothetical protein
MSAAVRDVGRSPFAAAAVVLLSYVAFVGVIHARGHPFHDLTFTGLHFIEQGWESPRIEADAAFAKPGTGYDGQFFLFIAQDPAHARHYLDDAAYRYGRIVYPMAARAIAVGQAEWIPAALVVFNVLAITLGTFAVAKWLTRRGSSPWLALFFGLFPGVFISVLRDLSEGAAYSFAALAFVTFDARRRRRLLASALLFALAILTRETTAVFALAAAVPLLFSGSRTRDVRGAATFLAVSLGRRTFCLGLAIWAMWRRSFEPPVLALAANALLFVVLLPWPSYDEFYASLRISTSVVPSLLLAVPILDRLLGRGRAWFWLPMIAWFAAWWQLLPIPFQEPGGYGW